VEPLPGTLKKEVFLPVYPLDLLPSFVLYGILIAVLPVFIHSPLFHSIGWYVKWVLSHLRQVAEVMMSPTFLSYW
jgi:hypothetical protein